MAESALAKKMKLKAGQQATIINAPVKYLKELKPLPEKVKLSQKLEKPSDWIQSFVKTKAELETLFPKALKFLKPESTLWICFPQGRVEDPNRPGPLLPCGRIKPGEAKQSFR